MPNHTREFVAQVKWNGFAKPNIKPQNNGEIKSTFKIFDMKCWDGIPSGNLILTFDEYGIFINRRLWEKDQQDQMFSAKNLPSEVLPGRKNNWKTKTANKEKHLYF